MADLNSAGHKDAWEKAKILHRDISVNNILIDIESPIDTPHGFLNDWDMSEYMEDMENPTALRAVSAW